MDAADECKWTKLFQWIEGMCVVTFDLNLGQALEYLYPPQYRPNEQEVSNICYNAFPDSNSNCMGDTQYHMRFRSFSDDCSQKYRCFNNQCIPILKADVSHVYGFVYFRQKRDTSLPRGYYQKSFIILTRLPFFNLFYEILKPLALKYFMEGNIVLEQACNHIESYWPAITAGVSLDLPLLEHDYKILIPKASSRKSNSILKETAGEQENTHKHENILKVISSINELELFQSLGFTIDNLFTLWELVISAEPIVVFGTSPADCSHMVQCLVSLIAPLQFCAEARPYFTIHDSEFKEFTRECGKSPPAIILGVTNPFFVKLLKDWPHLLRLVDNQVGFSCNFCIIYANIENCIFLDQHTAVAATSKEFSSNFICNLL